MQPLILNLNLLTINDVVNVARHHTPIEIGNDAIRKIQTSSQYIQSVLKSGKAFYGINTGFGKFADVKISDSDLLELQTNLVTSHACGMGEPFSEEIVRAIMLLRINALIQGYSGISFTTLNTLVKMLNAGVHPHIPSQGSLGASGDLAPLSHMVLPMIGLGKAYYKGKLMTGKEAMKSAGIETIVLQAKEGLALINGTQVMSAIASLLCADALHLAEKSIDVSMLTLQALKGIEDAFFAGVHEIRRQEGQIYVANRIREILKGSNLTTACGDIRVQDAYSLRCIPQILGPSFDTLRFAQSKIENEINAVTDNPLIFSEENKIISGGNFHGQIMAFVLDFMGIAIAEIANVSERRIERMVNPQLSNLPGFLTQNGGLHSGFMIAQYVAAALVSENKVYAHPASVDSIPSSANQEDHVSMGLTAGLKALKIFENTSKVIAIEWLTACQAIDFDDWNKLSPVSKKSYKKIRQILPFITHDVVLHEWLDKAYHLLQLEIKSNSAQ